MSALRSLMQGRASHAPGALHVWHLAAEGAPVTEITKEMREAMEFLRLGGAQWYATREVKLDCGCWVYGGWQLDRMEPGIGVLPCAGHRPAALRAVARWNDPEVKAGHGGEEATDVLLLLLREEIAR